MFWRKPSVIVFDSLVLGADANLTAEAGAGGTMRKLVTLLILGLSTGLSGCVTQETRRGFSLQTLPGDLRCKVLAYDGEIVIRQNKANGNRSVWGLGKCPRTLPGTEDAKIWRQERITIPVPHVALIQTRRNKQGIVQTISVRRNYNIRRLDRFAYVWVKHPQVQ
ncbi:hypothetical protein ACFSE1_08575 [Rhizobium helianthi]|uniref:Lipoprotein n=1 Tax=Rhizobium helianthi TaxID=1132695 RepID=A0ABW4M2I5_9HYPH